MKKLTIDEVINRFRKKHGSLYDYKLVEYLDSKTKVKIICKEHGIFEQTPNNHYKKGCQKCYFDSLRLNNNTFIEKASKIHNDEYDYSLIKYKTNKKKVKIICKEHGIFEQEPRNHLIGQKCPTCMGNAKITKKDFIKRSSKIHNDKYDYSLVNINGSKSSVIIVCPVHGRFHQVVDTHLRNHGCPKCRTPKGEKLISWFLTKKGVKFETQKMFDDCKDKRRLKFDFYIPEKNICIEFDGRHHFEEIEFGIDKLKDTIRKDNIKNRFCEKNNISLLRIRYDEIDIMYNKIEEFLN